MLLYRLFDTLQSANKKKASQIRRPRHLGLFLGRKIEPLVEVEVVAQVWDMGIHFDEALFDVGAAEFAAVLSYGKRHLRFDEGRAMECAGNSMCDICRTKHLWFGRYVEREMGESERREGRERGIRIMMISVAAPEERRQGRPSGFNRGNSQPGQTVKLRVN